MKITAVRVSKLVSGERFSNHSVALEATIDEDEDWERVAEDLRQQVDGQLASTVAREKLFSTRESLYEEIKYLEQRLDRLRGEIEESLKTIKNKGASEAELADDLPF